MHALGDLRLRRPHALRGRTTQAEGDVVEHAHVAEQGVVLEHEADLALAPDPAPTASSPWSARRRSRGARGRR